MDQLVLPDADGRFALERGAIYRFLAIVTGGAPSGESLARGVVDAGWAGVLFLWWPGQLRPKDWPDEGDAPGLEGNEFLVRGEGTWIGSGGALSWGVPSGGKMRLVRVWRRGTAIKEGPRPPGPGQESAPRATATRESAGVAIGLAVTLVLGVAMALGGRRA